MRLAEALARCDREIAEMRSRADVQGCPAWLVALGINDWEVEKRLLLEFSFMADGQAADRVNHTDEKTLASMDSVGRGKEARKISQSNRPGTALTKHASSGRWSGAGRVQDGPVHE